MQSHVEFIKIVLENAKINTFTMVGVLSILMGFWVAPEPIKSILNGASGLEATHFTPCLYFHASKSI